MNHQITEQQLVDIIKLIPVHSLPKLLTQNPDLIGVVHQRLTPTTWAASVARQPQLFNWCNVVDTFSSHDWFVILQNQPQLIDRCDSNVVDQFTGKTWSMLLQRQPTLADWCVWDKLTENDWFHLTLNQPQFEKIHELYII